MDGDGSLIKGLGGRNTEPEARGGTDWTAMSSNADGVIGGQSPVQVKAQHKVRYLNKARTSIGHSEFTPDMHCECHEKFHENYDAKDKWVYTDDYLIPRISLRYWLLSKVY